MALFLEKDANLTVAIKLKLVKMLLGIQAYILILKVAYGVAAAVSKIILAVANDTREILTVSTVLNGQNGIEGIAASLPCIVGKNGAEAFEIKMSEKEHKDFIKSCNILKKTAKRNKLV